MTIMTIRFATRLPATRQAQPVKGPDAVFCSVALHVTPVLPAESVVLLQAIPLAAAARAVLSKAVLAPARWTIIFGCQRPP